MVVGPGLEPNVPVPEKRVLAPELPRFAEKLGLAPEKEKEKSALAILPKSRKSDV